MINYIFYSMIYKSLIYKLSVFEENEMIYHFMPLQRHHLIGENILGKDSLRCLTIFNGNSGGWSGVFAAIK